jgi:hypothetical protein
MLSVNACNAQKSYNEKFVEAVIEGEIYPAYYDYIFMHEELIEIYKRDTNKLNMDISVFSRLEYGKQCDNYYFNQIKTSLKRKLLDYEKDCTQRDKVLILEKVIKSINTSTTPINLDSFSDWSEFYNCFFEDPGDEKNFSIFTLLFMGEQQLKSFLNNDENLEYWNSSVITDLSVGGGDFMENRVENGTNLLFERQANYILKRWENSENPTIQKTMQAFRTALKK